MGPGSWAPDTVPAPNQWADLHALLWSSGLPYPCSEAPGAHPTEQLPPAFPPLAMACWRLVLLTGALLAGEPSLSLDHPRVGWGIVSVPEGP